MRHRLFLFLALAWNFSSAQQVVIDPQHAIAVEQNAAVREAA